MMNIICLLLVMHYTFADENATDKGNNATSTSISVGTALIATSSAIATTEMDVTDFNVTTETPLTTTCEANSSCTVSTNDTSAKVNDTIGKEIKEVHHRLDLRTSPDKEFCTCNLQLNICDINCCCDRDCSIEDKFVFQHCEPSNLYYDTRYCDYMKYIYINNTPARWHVNQNGLFCVLKSNLPPSRTMQRKQPLETFEAAQRETLGKFKWPRYIQIKDVRFNASQDFRYGTNVWIAHRTGLRKFKVPKKYFTNACVTKADVFNLKNMESRCSQIDITEDNRYLNFKNYFENVTIVANPTLLKSSKFKSFQECPRNVCLSIMPKICDTNFKNCQNVSRNDSRLQLKCTFDIRNNKNHCRNAVKALQYNFHQNGTGGYTKVEVLGILEEVSYQFGGRYFEFVQEFKVNFWWTNQTVTNFSAILSGSPGYLVGKPVLTGNMVNAGNASNVILKVKRHPEDFPSNFLTVPENIDGKCALNHTNYSPIEFGYNLLTKCRLTANIINKKKYYNGTEVCREIQRMVLGVWGINTENRTVGMFGNANVNIPGDWTEIMYSMSLEKLLNRTVGRFNSANTTLTCFGIVNKVIVDVFHSRIDFKTLLNQEKVLGVTYTFAGFVNRTLQYNWQRNSTFLELDVETQAAFYDVSVEKVKKFVDAPSLEIRLPYDFFYPFIKIDNGTGVCSGNLMLYYLVFSLSVLMIK